MKLGWYWATHSESEEREIVRVSVRMDWSLGVYEIGTGRSSALEEWKDYVPVACEESAAALEAFDEQEWPFHLSEENAKLIEAAIAKNREHFVKDWPGEGEA